MLVDINKKYKTKNGKDVRIYMINDHDMFPVHGAINYEEGWVLESWTLNGSYSHDTKNYESMFSLKEVK